MAADNTNEMTVRISYDEMEAFLTLPVIAPIGGYQTADILHFLEMKNVRAGINDAVIEHMIKDKIYGREIRVAAGIREIDGQDGYYEYHFNRELNHKPLIRDDGSVDYWSIHMVEMVEEGQVIAVYHEPVEGRNGMTVKGKAKIAKHGRPLPPLVGVGFERSEDGQVYTSLKNGKIEMKNGRITISEVYEVFGNADLSTGNIDFRGDLVIHGNIASGVRVVATGSVTVDGFVEACMIKAGKDVVIRGGMIGASRGTIQSQGNVFIKFAEYAKIEAAGAVQSCAFLNCQVNAGDKVYANGTKGVIIGGMVYGVRGVDTNAAGNSKETDTEIVAGAGIATMTRLRACEEKIAVIRQEIAKIDSALKMIEERAKAQNTDMKNDPTRVSLLRTKIVRQADLGSAQEELHGLQTIVDNAKEAAIRIYREIYPGVTLYIHDQKKQVTERQEHVEYEVSGEKIKMYQIEA